MMMEDGMFGVMADETNAYAALCQCEKDTDDRLWTPTDGSEIKAYIGISMLMELIPFMNIQITGLWTHTWKTLQSNT